MDYPHYIVTWSEGRLPCPPQYRGTVIQRQFDNGRIGGRKNIEKRVQTASEAFRMLCQDRMNRTVYEVPARNRYRRRLRFSEIERLARESES
jgi:hypothetical protein